MANPNKIIAAPVNYKKHMDEAREDEELHQRKTIHPIEKAGLFLKANSSLAGPGEGVAIRFEHARNDHEVELVAWIENIGSMTVDVRATTNGLPSNGPPLG